MIKPQNAATIMIDVRITRPVVIRFSKRGYILDVKDAVIFSVLGIVATGYQGMWIFKP